MHEPLTTSLLMELIAKLHIAFPRNIGEKNPAMMADVYRNGLRGLPGDSVRIAVDQAIQTEQYFPKVSKLRELASAHNRQRTVDIQRTASWDECPRCGARVKLIDVFRPTGEIGPDGKPEMFVLLQRYDIQHDRRAHGVFESHDEQSA